VSIKEFMSFCLILIVPVLLPAQSGNSTLYPDGHTVDASVADTGYESDIAIDQQDYLHISYYDATNGDLKYARQATDDLISDGKFLGGTRYGDWLVFTVDSVGTVGRYSSIKIDSLGRPCISYYDVNNKALKFARFNGQKWLIQYADTGNVGIYTSLALDRSDRPYISYYDAKRKALKCAQYDGFKWNVEEVDRDINGDLGLYTSIAIGVDGLARISYYDNKNGKLKFAKSRAKDWVIEDVDTGENSKVGIYSSLALGSNDTPHIAYYDTTNNNLRYAVKKGFSWEKKVVDEKRNVGKFASIKLDNSGYPWIAYYDSSACNLRLAQFDGVKWLISFPVATTNQFGMDCSLCIDRTNNWHISCRDLTYRKLAYVNNRTIVDQDPLKKWRWNFR